MSKRVGLFVNGNDPSGNLKAGKSDVNRLFNVMMDADKGSCCVESSEKHLSIDTPSIFITILMNFLNKLEPTDQMVFYFSGHGKIDGTKYYLKFGDEELFFDIILSYLQGKHITKAIIIIDACFSGEIAKSDNGLILKDSIPEGIAFLTSSTEEEYSHENETKTYSVFTELLCECIETGNNNSITQNNLITISDVIEYVRNNNTHSKQQQPKQKILNAKEDIWISKNITKIILNNEKKDFETVDSISDYDRINYEGASFTERLNDNATIDDLEWDLVCTYIKNKKIEIDLEKSKKFILSELGFYKDNKLLNSVVINFGIRPDKFVYQAFVSAAINKGNTEEFYGSIPKLLKETVNFILTKIDKYSEFNDVRDDDYVVPRIIIREAISNALTHRCYGNSECNTPIKVIISNEKKQLEISSPGNFLGDYKEIMSDSDNDFSLLRDSQMGEFSKFLGVSETFGRGFDYFRDYVKKYGNDFVKFKTTPTHTKIILKFRDIEGVSIHSINTKVVKTIPSSLTKKLGMNSHSFLGRDKELTEIDNILKNSNSLLIYGIGGIGKSSLASKYLAMNKDKYDYYGYIVVEDNINNNFIAKLRDSLTLQRTKIEDSFSESIEILSSLDGRKLLIIDDIRDPQNQKQEIENILDLENYNYKLIFTSRVKINGIVDYSLMNLSPETALNIFNKYYEGVDEFCSIKVDKILSFLDYHPLFIELITKTLSSEGYTLDEILDKFETGKLSEIKFINENSGYEANLNENLKELFSMQKLESEYVLLLKRFSLLPSIEIDISVINNILGGENLKGKLTFLVKRGWLIQHNNHYKLHQIIKEYILANHKLEFAEIESIIDFYNSSFTQQLKEYHQDDTIYFDSILRVLINIEIQTHKVLEFFNHVGEIYNYVGKYMKALESFKASNEICLKLYSNESEESLLSLNNLADTYNRLGFDSKALKLYLKTVTILKENHKDKQVDIAIVYGNIANSYQQLKNIEKAEMFQRQAIEILRKELGEDSIEIAACYNNLALIYQSKKRYTDSLMYFKKSITIITNIEGDNNPAVAKKYDNLALLYGEIGKTEFALDAIRKSLKIKQDLYDENHPEMAFIYFYISDIYLSNKECYKAIFYAKKSIDIYAEIHAFTHPNLKYAKDLIKRANLNIKKEKNSGYRKKGKYCIDNEKFDIEI